MRSKLRGISPGKLEELIEDLFKKSGYETTAKKRFDKKGGDADLVLTTKIPLISDYNDAYLNVYVQIKNKDGEDLKDHIGVEQLIKISENDTNCLKILITTADRFTDKAEKMAEDNNVILIDGLGISKLLLRYM